MGERPIEERLYYHIRSIKTKIEIEQESRGIEIASRLEMGDLFEKLQGFHLGYKFTIKGRDQKTMDYIQNMKNFEIE